MSADNQNLHHHHINGLSPHHHYLIDTTPTAELHHNIDLVTTLRSELAALCYKRDRLANELADSKTALCSKETECETLRAQAARQSALIASLQSRLLSAENREQSIQSRSDSTIQTVQRERRASEERNKELLCKIQHLETHITSEETQKEQYKVQLQDLLKRLSICLNIDVCENAHISPECILTRTEEIVAELQRLKAKIISTCDTLSSCEDELLNVKSLANIEKQRLCAQLESTANHNRELENRCRHSERELQLIRDRLTESEINSGKLKEELRGFESRCHRLQSNLDRSQSDRLQFLRCLANQLNVSEPCETLIKDKLSETIKESQSIHMQVHNLRNQLSAEHEKLKETQETNQCRFRDEEAKICELEKRLERCQDEIHSLRADHMGLPEFLQRLARALNWRECSTPPALGADTNIMAESLLECAERLKTYYEHHGHDITPAPEHHLYHLKGCHMTEKRFYDNCYDNSTKARRERSCLDMPLKESTSIYNLQRRVRILREQVQRRDLHLELLKRKLAIIEDGAKGKCLLQGERDEAVCRAKKANKHADRLTAQLTEVRSQLTNVKAQLAEAVEYKITALERARKIDELTSQICDLEEEKSRLTAHLNTVKERLKSSNESAKNRLCRDEALINSLREDVARLQTQLTDTNHRLSNLQSFRTSVARTLHLRDLPETDLLHRLQALCSAHQEFTILSKRYETASPIGDHPCPRYDDPVPPSTHCLPPRHIEMPPDITEHPTGVHVSHSAHRHRIKTNDKRIHDECFESDVHRHHCKTDLKYSGCKEFNFKTKYC